MSKNVLKILRKFCTQNILFASSFTPLPLHFLHIYAYEPHLANKKTFLQKCLTAAACGSQFNNLILLSHYINT